MTARLRIILDFLVRKRLESPTKKINWHQVKKALEDKKIKPGESTVRSDVVRLRDSVAAYYRQQPRTHGRFTVAERGYSVTWEPHARPTGGSGSPQDRDHGISIQRFRRFLLRHLNEIPVDEAEYNKNVFKWAKGKIRLKELVQTAEAGFDELFEAVESLTYEEMTSLTEALGVHPLLLDPERAQATPEGWLVLRVDDDGHFRKAPRGEVHHYGHNVQYSFATRILEHSDPQFVHLEFFPPADNDPRQAGSSDRHLHPGEEMALILEGSIELRFRESGIRSTLSKGDIAHYYSEQTHEAIFKSGNPSARALFIRYFHEGRPGEFQTRQAMRNELRRWLNTEGKRQDKTLDPTVRCGLDTEGVDLDNTLDPTVRRWVLQTLVGGAQVNAVPDGPGLYKLLTAMTRQPDPAKTVAFLRRVNAEQGTQCTDLSEWLTILRDGSIRITHRDVTELAELYTPLDALFQGYLYPAVPNQVVCRRNDPSDMERHPVKSGAVYQIPRRRLSCSDVSANLLTIPHGDRILDHSHPGTELLVPIEGEVSIEFADAPGEKHDVSAFRKELAHYRSDREHTVQNNTDHEAILFVVRFYSDVLPDPPPRDVS